MVRVFACPASSIFLIVSSIFAGGSALAQSPYSRGANSTADAANILGAISTLKSCVAACGIHGMDVPVSRRELLRQRMGDWERIEIEMHYSLVSGMSKSEGVSPQQAARIVQRELAGVRADAFAGQSKDQFDRMCAGLAEGLFTKSADIEYMYGNLLTGIRAP